MSWGFEEAGEFQWQPNEQEIEIVQAVDGRYRLVMSDTITISDGATMWTIQADGQYTQGDSTSLQPKGGGWVHDFVDSITSLEVTEVDLEGESGRRFSGMRSTDRGTERFSVWVSAETSLIGEWISFEASSNRDGYSAHRNRFRDKVLEPELPDDVFTFTPGPEHRLVEAFDWVAAVPEPEKPTIALAEGSLDQERPERMRLADFRNPAGANRSVSVDTDRDGVDELVIIGDDRLTIFDAEDATSSYVVFKDLPPGTSIAYFDAVRSADELDWLLTFKQKGLERGPWNSSCGLWDETGHRRFYYSPELPGGFSCELRAVAGDLDGDGSAETVIALKFWENEKTGERSWTQRDPRQHVVVLDRTGKRIAQRRVPFGIHWLKTVADSNGRTMIVVGYDGGFSTIEIDLER